MTHLIKKYRNQWTIGIILLKNPTIIVLLSVIGILPSASGPIMICNMDCTKDLAMKSLFTAPSNKITMFNNPSLTGQPYTEAIATEPLLAIPGTPNADRNKPDDWINGKATTPVTSG
jgi:hypothetical protein